MSQRNVRRAVLFVILAGSLALPGGALARGSVRGRGDVRTSPAPAGWVGLLGGWLKEGCGIDPWGLCKTVFSPGSSNEEGCIIDPWGRCAPPTSHAGCGTDPWGTCEWSR